MPTRFAWNNLAFWLCIAALAIYLGLAYSSVPSSPDQAMFDYIGWLGSQGGHYYLDAVEQNWPGKMILHQIAFYLFGNHLWSYRLFDFLLMSATSLSFIFLLGAYAREKIAFILLPIYQAVYVTSGYWFAGQRDIVAGNFLLMSVAIYLRSLRSSRAWLWQITVGACLAFVMLIRPTYLMYAPVFLVIAFFHHVYSARHWQQFFSDILFATLGFFALVLAVLAVAKSNGSLSAWYEAAVQFNLQIYSVGQSLSDTVAKLITVVRSWHWYLVVSFIGAGLWIRKEGLNPALFASGSLILVGIISAVMQKKGFHYHLGAILPALSLFITYAVISAVKLFRLKPPHKPINLLFLAVLLITPAGLAKKISGQQIIWPSFDAPEPVDAFARFPAGSSATVKDATEVSLHISQHSDQQDKILIWGRPVYIYNLANRKSATRFFNVGMLATAHRGFEGADAWYQTYTEELRVSPAKFIVVPEKKFSTSFDGLISQPDSPFVQHLTSLLRAEYEYDRQFGSLIVYRRK